MSRDLVKAIILLPGTVLVLIPAVILLAGAAYGHSISVADPDQMRFWAALLFAGTGLFLSVWTVSLFTRFGRGTPAPWQPPQQLVIRGPYRHVRNPMITSVLLVLIGEALMLGSWLIGAWMLVFLVGNAVYFPLVEERGLEKRFGSSYLQYKTNVPRWVPRLQPWKQPEENPHSNGDLL